MGLCVYGVLKPCFRRRARLAPSRARNGTEAVPYRLTSCRERRPWRSGSRSASGTYSRSLLPEGTSHTLNSPCSCHPRSPSCHSRPRPGIHAHAPRQHPTHKTSLRTKRTGVKQSPGDRDEVYSSSSSLIICSLVCQMSSFSRRWSSAPYPSNSQITNCQRIIKTGGNAPHENRRCGPR